MGFFWDSIEELWQTAYEAHGELDQAVAKVITDPWHRKDYELGGHVLHVRGPEVLKADSPTGWMCIGGDTINGPCIDEIWLLGGPLPNGRDYLSQFGWGHEGLHFLTGLENPDHLCEGL